MTRSRVWLYTFDPQYKNAPSYAVVFAETEEKALEYATKLFQKNIWHVKLDKDGLQEITGTETYLKGAGYY